MTFGGSEVRGSESPGVRDAKSTEADRVIREVLTHASAPCITSSFQAECMVLTHLLLEAMPEIPVLFLDTFHHFAQTYAYRDEMAAAWKMKLVTLQAAEPKIGLWQESTEKCCAVHKVGPLFAALDAHDVWFTALRRDQSPSRANLQEVEPFRLPSGTIVQRVSPLASWTAKDVWAYAKAHGIPLLPLYEAGYTSIGCEPCTTPPIDPDNPRSGRWQGQKLECGIHVQAK